MEAKASQVVPAKQEARAFVATLLTIACITGFNGDLDVGLTAGAASVIDPF